MPTFDFQCQKCDAVFEFSRPFGSSEHPACPTCGTEETEKLIAPPAIHFKGSGFYKTDGATKAASKKEEPKSDDKAEKKPKTKPEEPKKSEAKPAETKQSTSAPNGATVDKGH